MLVIVESGYLYCNFWDGIFRGLRQMKLHVIKEVIYFLGV